MLSPKFSASSQPFERTLLGGLVLAGGRGMRLGGVNKGLQCFSGKPLIEHALERLQTQVLDRYISANADIEKYKALGFPVLHDAPQSLYQGPLAGMLAGLRACAQPWLLCVPCDAPYFPWDLARRLWEQTMLANSGSAYIVEHPVFCLLHQRQTPALELFLAQGGRKVRAWHEAAKASGLPWDDPEAFTNLNQANDDWR